MLRAILVSTIVAASSASAMPTVVLAEQAPLNLLPVPRPATASQGGHSSPQPHGESHGATPIVAPPEAPPATEPIVSVPEPSPSAEDRQLMDEPSPSFQPIRPTESVDNDASPLPAQPIPLTPPPAVQPSQPAAVSPAGAPQVPAAMPVTSSLVANDDEADFSFPWEDVRVGPLMILGAAVAAFFGILTALIVRAIDRSGQRRAVAAMLAVELETRLQAYEAVPLPPNVEAGVSFVSSVTSLAGIDAGFRAAQGQLHRLPGKLAAHVSVHYAAVQRVSDFVKGQSLAAAVRMLQANRIGGHPCPDAGIMRDAHSELGLAFRGIEKLILGLKKYA